MGQRITIELPEWAQERHIYILAGIEMVAYKLYGEDILHIKTVRCRLCGDCCEGLPIGGILPVKPNGNCSYLGESVGGVRECSLGVYRPIGCSVGLQKRNHPKCAVEYKVEGMS